MKRLLLVFFMTTLFCGKMWTQCPQDDITLTTQTQVDSFLVLYPNCTNMPGSLTIGYINIPPVSNITNLAPLSNLTSIGGNLSIGSNDSMLNLVGLHNIVSVGMNLHIQGNGLLNNLTGLESLNTVEGYFAILANSSLINLQGLNNLNPITNHIAITDNNALLSLTGLENLTRIELFLTITGNNALTNLNGLNNLTSIGADGNLFIKDNENLENLYGLNSLTTVEGDLTVRNSEDVESLIGLENLTTVGGFLRITDNYSLYSIHSLSNLTSIGEHFWFSGSGAINLEGLENLISIGDYFDIIGHYQLSSIAELESLNSIGGRLKIAGNQQLGMCSELVICNHLGSGGQYSIYNNDIGCDNVTEVLEGCNSFGKIQSRIFQDVNQNKVQDAGEPSYLDASILVEPGGLITFPNMDNGNVFYVQPGSYTATFNQATSPDWMLTTDSISYFLNLDVDECDSIAFGIYPIIQMSSIQPFITSPPVRCNEVVSFDINARNLGTTTADGILWLEVDENILATNFINTPDTTVAPNRYGWFFDDLYPSYAVEKQIALQIPGPPDFPVGDLLEFNTYADFEDENGVQTSATFTYAPEVRCSYDPNDKLVNPAREGDYALFDEDLIYTVRFQNTGNDVAYDVVILDTLDANLDRETFRLLGSSHAERLNTSMDAEGVLTFEFRDIFLPDSTSNFEGSQGYVSYLIRTIDGLAENTPVTNSAGIYFDLNPPVITNTTQSIMVSELPTVSVQSPDNELDFDIIPNPNTGTFYIQGATNGTYRIFNAMGQVIHSGLLNKDAAIDVPQAASGIYFIEIREEERVGTRRFVKQ